MGWMKLPWMRPTGCASSRRCVMASQWIPLRSCTSNFSWRIEKHGDKSYAHFELDGHHPVVIGERGGTATGRPATDVAAGADVSPGGNARNRTACRDATGS